MKKIIHFVLLSSISLGAWSQVWEDQEQWTPEWEERFSEWFKTSAVHKDMFVSANSPYRGILADCADVAYVVRAIFAYENKLHFSARNPVANANSATRHFSNRMNQFNHIKDPQRRFVEFANFLGNSLGTETLAANDSYPVKLSKIVPGEMYLYKVRNNNQFVRHNYNIKNIDTKGNFDLIYATQATRASRSPMVHKVKGLYNPPSVFNWGFRRYDYGISYNQQLINTRDQWRGDEQFQLARTLTSNQFFAHVRTLLRKEIESPEDLLKKHVSELCGQVRERVDIVAKGLEHLGRIGGQCMNYRDFDTHSTPSRDRRLVEIINNLVEDYRDMSKDDLKKVSTQTLDLYEALVDQQPSSMARSQLLSFCPISYKMGENLDLRTIKDRALGGRLSSHPNDSLENRWGEKTTGRTRCAAFY
jgi:molybdopterin converting factor small subunit